MSDEAKEDFAKQIFSEEGRFYAGEGLTDLGTMSLKAANVLASSAYRETKFGKGANGAFARSNKVRVVV